MLKIIILNLSIIKTNVSIFYFFLIGNENHPLYKSRTVSEYDFEVRRNISKYMFQFKPWRNEINQDSFFPISEKQIEFEVRMRESYKIFVKTWILIDSYRGSRIPI